VIVAGVMSGTSADGINVAIVRISRTTDFAAQDPSPKAIARPHLKVGFELLGSSEIEYPAGVRQKILENMNSRSASVADLARLNFLLGELYADAISATARKLKVKPQLVGCHGQTLYHQGDRQNFLGRRVAATWQTGEGAVISERMGVPVVSDFRPADIAAGGKGAPLVPLLDYLLYCDAKVGRIVQNIGGIANLTAIPANASAKQIIAFDTGPGNMVMDAVTEHLFGKTYDRDGRIAARGQVLKKPLDRALQHKFFGRKPPKTAGREEFGREFVKDFLKNCGRARKEDVITTACALTARSIALAVRKFVVNPQPRARFREMIVSGGGAKNPTLIKMLNAELHSLNLVLRRSDEFGLPSEAKEAVAFAVLAYQAWHQAAGNIPSATGAKHPAVLGKISYV
jgi:anhydro-N-acetylmuramic acid kinase